MFLKSGIIVVEPTNREILGLLILEIGKSDRFTSCSNRVSNYDCLRPVIWILIELIFLIGHTSASLLYIHHDTFNRIIAEAC
jgi:hypothetical protein